MGMSDDFLHKHNSVHVSINKALQSIKQALFTMGGRAALLSTSFVSEQKKVMTFKGNLIETNFD